MSELTIKESGEYNRMITNFAISPQYTARVNRKLAQRIMENVYCFCRGEMRHFKVKSVGVGLYDVTTYVKDTN